MYHDCIMCHISNYLFLGFLSCNVQGCARFKCRTIVRYQVLSGQRVRVTYGVPTREIRVLVILSYLYIYILYIIFVIFVIFTLMTKYSIIVNSPRPIQNLAFSLGGLPGKVAPTCVYLLWSSCVRQKTML